MTKQYGTDPGFRSSNTLPCMPTQPKAKETRKQKALNQITVPKYVKEGKASALLRPLSLESSHANFLRNQPIDPVRLCGACTLEAPLAHSPTQTTSLGR